MAVKVVASGGSGAVGPAGADGAPGSAGAATLDGATIIGATSVTIDALPPDLVDGSYIAIDVGTSNCEVRRVDGIASLTLTLNSALKVAHSDGVKVRVRDNYMLSPEWWGATTDSTVDSYRSLINMFMDCDGANFGVGGSGTATLGYYRSSRPLYMSDKMHCNISLATLGVSSFAIDCTEAASAWNGIPNQYFFVLAGQKTTATFNSVTDEVTLGTSVGDTDSDVIFYPRPGSSMPGGIEEGRRYHVLSAATTTTISKSPGGSAVDITSNGSGEIVAVSAGLARLHGRLVLLGNRVKGLNGFLGQVQQPSDFELHTELFPVVGATIAADQGRFKNIFIQDSWIGLELAGALMTYFPQGNVEQCDYNVVFAETDRRPNASTGTNRGIEIGNGFHFETAGTGTSQIQTLKPSATLTSGTFKLQFKNVKTGFINWNATAAQVQSALEAHAAIGAGNVTCTQLTGTNMSDGNIQCDFTVGTLQWEQWSGSTSTSTGGEMAVTDSTVAGGSISVNTVNPDGQCISFRNGRGCRIAGAMYSNASQMADGTKVPFIQFEGTAVDVSQGVTQGCDLFGISLPSSGIPFVNDDLHGVNITSDIASTTGIAQVCHHYMRPGRDSSNTHRPIWWMGDKGRRLVFSAAGAPMVELQAASTGQNHDLMAWLTSAAATAGGVDKNGHWYTAKTSAPADADIAAGECFFWFDSTNGAAKIKFKAKQADGTVRSGEVALS